MTKRPIDKMCNMDTAPYYRIVEYVGPMYFLAEKVNLLMEEGWAPLGPPFNAKGPEHWLQAMVKVDTPDITKQFEDISNS